MRALMIASCFLATLALCGGNAARAAGEEQKPAQVKPPTPARALQVALAKLGKAESYRARVSIDGGISDRESHEVTEPTVREAYSGDVFGSLMYVPTAKAYRYPKKGVAYVDGAWRNILSDIRTTRLDRLFTFPEVIMNRALTHAPKGGRWLTAQEEKARGLPPLGVSAPASDEEDEVEVVNAGDDEEEEEEEEETEEPEAAKPGAKGKATAPTPGKTVAVKPKENLEALRMPRVVRVEAPPEEAIKHFTEVQNSGCMSAG